MCSKSALKLFEEISKQCPEYVENLFNFRGKYVKNLCKECLKSVKVVQSLRQLLECSLIFDKISFSKIVNSKNVKSAYNSCFKLLVLWNGRRIKRSC